MIAQQTLNRTVFTMSRALEFFSEKELQQQIGYDKDWWPIALVKELLDNAVDACERSGLPPHVQIVVEDHAVTIRDNGPGLPHATLEKSLDYMVRASDKALYVAPTRGQLGNALKCVWAAPYVVTGDHGDVCVSAHGERYHIHVGLNRIAQQPDIIVNREACDVKIGTIIKMDWPELASYLSGEKRLGFYNAPMTIADLARAYAAFNPHVTIDVVGGGADATYPARDPKYSKWMTNRPTSPHWYTVERLRALIAGYLSAGEDKTIRAFIQEFDGLSSTSKARDIAAQCGLTGASLRDLVRGSDIDADRCADLLAALQLHARAIKPTALGPLGKHQLVTHLTGHFGASADTVKYKQIEGVADGVPYVFEVSFGVYNEAHDHDRARIALGVNWTPALNGVAAIPMLGPVLSEQYIQRESPVTLIAHLACARVEYPDRGKTRLLLRGDMGKDISDAVRTVTNDWRKANLKAIRESERNERVSQRQLDEMRKAERERQWSIKDAAYIVMERAYNQASDNGKYPAPARQIMYQARPLVLKLTGDKCWKNSSYFTQELLPAFMEDNPELTADWDVVFDDRGALWEPHTEKRVGIGTLSVRRYQGDWHSTIDADMSLVLLRDDLRKKTGGPSHRYRFVLFIEKEGFAEIINTAQLAERYDIAIMSTKGMSTTAARRLVDALSQCGVTILVARDFDKAGFSIQHTLQNDSRRYTFKARPRVIDLGLRLTDVQEMALEHEPVTYEDKADPRINLRERGATVEECQFLVSKRDRISGQWEGERVELNAMTSPQFIAWLERKLDEVGVTKFVPEEKAVIDAYRRAWRIAKLNKMIADAIDELPDDDAIDIPDDLRDRLTAALDPDQDGDATLSWDMAIAQIARQTGGAA